MTSSTNLDDQAVVTQGLTKRFGDLAAVDGIDLEVASGTVVSLLGPNGAGKTTMVRLLATLSAPTSGTATVCGYDVVREADAVRGVISLTGQFAALEDNLTAKENLALMARLRGYGRTSAAHTVERLIDRFDIGEFRDKLVKSLSGGQRRRVDLAASLVVQPRLLVLDEPTTGLDPRSRQVVWATVRDLVNEGVTVLLTTQYLEEADALADRIMLIDHGRSVAAGTPSQLKGRIGDQRVDVMAVDATGLDELVTLLGSRFAITVSRERRTVSVPAPDDLADLAAITEVVRADGLDIEELALRRPTLDDAFLALTGQPATDRADATGTGQGRAGEGGPRPAGASSAPLPTAFDDDELAEVTR
jgi:ABC-2 type transport system ATP-binding protein